MNKMLKSIVCAAVIVAPFALAGCKSDDEKAISLMEEMADIIDGSKDNCDQMAEKLSKFQESKGKELKELKDKDKGKSEDDKKKAMEKYKDRIEAAGKKMAGGMMKCMTNEKVQKAMKD